jgi:hypothetical protein
MANYIRATNSITNGTFVQADETYARRVWFTIGSDVYNGRVAKYVSATNVLLSPNGNFPLVDEVISSIITEQDGTKENSILNITEVKTYLKILSTDATQNDFLVDLIAIATDKIEKFTRSVFKQQNVTEIVSGNGRNNFYPTKLPIVSLLTNSITDIQQKTTPTSEWENIETDTSYIMIEAATPYYFYLYRDVFPKGKQNIRLKYVAGYTVIPASIKQVALEMVAEIYSQSRQGSGRLGQSSRSISTGAGGSGSDSFFDLTEKHKNILSQFILPSFENGY